jgi:hypothetical protein
MIKKSCIFLIFVMFLSGCSVANYRSYDGSPLPIEQLAFVSCDEYVSITKINGIEVKLPLLTSLVGKNTCFAELTPGRHTIAYKLTTGGGMVSMHVNEKEIEITVVAGDILKIYQKYETLSWSSWIEKLEGEKYDAELKRIISNRVLPKNNG